MTAHKVSVNQLIRECHQNSATNCTNLPVLQLGAELDQVFCESGQLEILLAALVDTLALFFESNPLVLQTGIVGAPMHRRFSSATDGSFLTISLGSRTLPIGCLDHTPGSEFTELAAIKRLTREVNEMSGTLLVTDIGGKLRRIRCILPLPERESTPDKHGRETILLVEDEEFVRNVTREVLELSGYTVLEAIDAESGIKIFHQHADNIDLLLTDVVMPGMNGHDLAMKLFAISPELRAIFMSGYTENAITRKGFSDPRLVYLQKPFTLDVLTKKVREVLDTTAITAPPAMAAAVSEASRQ